MAFQALGPRFTDAFITAADLHRQQRRKGTSIPYVSHLLAVAAIALEFGADEDEAIAALLHDAIEDAPKQLGSDGALVVRRLLAMKFGDRVLSIVEACTDAETRPKPSWRARKEQYIDSIAEKTASEVLVSVADKLHNACAILRDFHALGDALWRRFNPEAGKTGTLGYYRGLVMAFERRIDQLQDPRLKPSSPISATSSRPSSEKLALPARGRYRTWRRANPCSSYRASSVSGEMVITPAWVGIRQRKIRRRLTCRTSSGVQSPMSQT
jgi:hypothetical protein